MPSKGMLTEWIAVQFSGAHFTAARFSMGSGERLDAVPRGEEAHCSKTPSPPISDAYRRYRGPIDAPAYTPIARTGLEHEAHACSTQERARACRRVATHSCYSCSSMGGALLLCATRRSAEGGRAPSEAIASRTCVKVTSQTGTNVSYL